MLPVKPKSLIEKLEEAIEIDSTIETKNGTKELPEHVIQDTKRFNIAHAIAEHISEVSFNSNKVEKTVFDEGSGDTGRQAEVRITPTEDVSMSELSRMGEQIHDLLEIGDENGIFPYDYKICIARKFGPDENEEPEPKDEFYLCLAYQPHDPYGTPQKPPATEKIIN